MFKNLKGEHVQSVDALTANVVASIEQAAARDRPVIDPITPFVPPSVLL